MFQHRVRAVLAAGFLTAAFSAPALAGGVTSLTTQAATAERSAGCATIQAAGTQNSFGDPIQFTASLNMIAGEVFTITPAGLVTAYSVSDIDGDAGFTTVNSGPGTSTITIAATTSVQLRVQGVGGVGTLTFACTGAPSSSSSGATPSDLVNADVTFTQGNQLLGQVFEHLDTLSVIGGGLAGGQLGFKPTASMTHVGGQSVASAMGIQTTTGEEEAIRDWKFSTWVSATYTDAENSDSINRFDGHIISMQGGIDYRFTNDLIAGVALGTSNIRLDDVGSALGAYDEDSYSIAPYAQYRIGRMFTLGATAGYAYGDVTQRNSGTGVEGDTDSDMWFAAVRGAGHFEIYERTRLTGRVGYTFLNKDVAGFVDQAGTSFAGSDAAQLNTFSLGGELGRTYTFGLIVTEPYIGADLKLDAEDATNDDPTAMILSGGVRGEGPHGVFFTVDGSTQLFRKNYRSYTVGGRIGLNF